MTTVESLQGKNIVLGVSGGIAAYKAADLTRRLIERGAVVRVVMTRAATEFVAPLTFQALSGNPVHLDLLDTAAEAAMGHIELARWADLILIAPASADMMSRIAAGAGDDLLTTLCLATEAPLVLAPAMNQMMWQNRFTQRNKQTLENNSVTLLGPGVGEQACGEVGAGRMLEPLEIIDGLLASQPTPQPLAGKRVVITAGPTREAIDPVRYISNHSSGKMGYALAAAARDAGAQVTVISGPVAIDIPAGVKLEAVESARQMHDQAINHMGRCDIFIAAAAVADYRPVNAEAHKMKKQGDQANLVLELTENPDIVASVGHHPQRPFTVGFAAETQDVISYAKGKLERKKLDMIIANNVADSSIGFNSDVNAVTVIWQDGEEDLAKTLKSELAKQLILTITEHYLKKVTKP